MRTNATLPQKPKKENTQHRHVLEVMAILYGWKSIAEVGIWKGDTGAYLLEQLPDLLWFGIDPFQIPPGSMDEPGYCNYGKVDMDAVYAGTVKRMSQFGDRAQVVRASSEAGAKGFGPKRQFDAVFIDADHRFEFVIGDINVWAPLVKVGGWLLGHDYDMPSVRKAVEYQFQDRHISLPDRTWAIQI